MLHLLGNGVFPHVATASMELQTLCGHLILEIRRPEEKRKDISNDIGF